MKRILKTIFCACTICAMVSFVGCGKNDDAGTKAKDGGAKTSQDAGSTDKSGEEDKK